MTDFVQRALNTLVIFDRRENQYEKLRTAIESDPRLKVTTIQVRRYMKTDRQVYSFSRGGMLSSMLLIFEFICPCGETRKEAFSLPLDWKQPAKMAETKEWLSKFVYKHPESEGLLT